MKKSKVIVPALALIAFSTAASITGTVAWFTSSRKATITAGTYQVVSQTSNLVYDITERVGTTVSGEAGRESVNIATGYKLTDASFDHTSKIIYIPNEDGDALKDADGNDAADADGDSLNTPDGVPLASMSTSNMQRGDAADKVYSAVSFDISFTMNFGSVGHNMGLYLDCSADHSRFDRTADAFDAETGFRMAIIGNTASVTTTRVFADKQSFANSKYIKTSHTDSDGEGTADVAGPAGSFLKGGDAYVSPALIDSSYSTAVPADDSSSTGSGITEATAEGRVDYLGKFTFAANDSVTLSYTVVCWYEGTDPNVMNGKSLGSLAATLCFEAATFKAAA